MKNDETESTSARSSTVKTVKEPELIPSQEPTSKLIIALIPSIVIITSLLISGFVACLFRKKICKKRNKMKKDDMVSKKTKQKSNENRNIRFYATT